MLKSLIEKRLWDLQRFGFTSEKVILRFRSAPQELKPLFMTSMPKSGTHLLERILCLHPAIYRPLIPTLNPRNIEVRGGWKRHVSALRSGQLLVTHAYYDPDLAAMVNQKGAAKFLMVRDPRAIVLSNAHYLRTSKKHRLYETMATMSLSECIDFCIEAPVMADGLSFVEIMQRFCDWAGEADTLVVRFEDIVSGTKRDRVNLIGNILSHAGIPQRLVDAESVLASAVSPASPTFRSGKVDEWREVLSNSQKELVSSKISDVVSRFGYIL